MKNEAMKLALDLAIMHHTDEGYYELRSKVRVAAKEALAEQEQVEPVAWRVRIETMLNDGSIKVSYQFRDKKLTEHDEPLYKSFINEKPFRTEVDLYGNEFKLYLHPQQRKPLTVRVWGWVWKDKLHEGDLYIPSYTPAQHVPRGELLALVDPADLHNPLENTVWHIPSVHSTKE